ncbi:superoxide dismutase [Novosphingobium sp. Chol11]|uniref:superoxide dismutase n=1 Tax=Novosphingobium sp. Chol11 TaxID=1385763 RepID=UPI0025FC6C8F|nr:Fe-Mn family superoxide dismutase [Novosphingobium sp. Chol11]
MNRRTALTAAATLTAATALPSPGRAQTAPFAPTPVAFDASLVPGLSAKMLNSHHDNNYVGAVKRLGAIKADFAKLDPATAPGFVINGLKREELLAWNSMILHEIYFSSLGQPIAPGKALAQAIERDFGSQTKWAAEFTAMGRALGGGSGWVLLQWSPHDGRLTNQWANDHTMTLAGGTPILAMDMYEHAYQMDFGAKAAAYVDAYMAATNWAAADARFAKVLA